MFVQKPEGNFEHGTKHVYFICHPDDYEKYFKKIYEDIRKCSNCVVWYNSDENYDTDDISIIEKMNLFVVPITTNLLTKKCRAINQDVPYAIQNNKPILPLMQESELDELFYKYFNDLQYLDPNSHDSTAISYEEKLKKFLNSILVGDEIAAKVRAAFDAYIFLSYRKKDRKYANELMQLIHQNDFCRDIAIWYDEYLNPGENFNDAILNAIQKSELFTMVVTPNLINEENYVKRDEYPNATKQEKIILPVEMVQTDHDELLKQYPAIPNSVDGQDNIALSNALKASLIKIAHTKNDTDPQHNFFMGLAYLNGIDVEINHKRALQLITSAAESSEVPEAIEKLVSMYQDGHGVKRNYIRAIEWQQKLVDYREIQAKKSNTESDNKLMFEALLFLIDQIVRVRSFQDAESTINKMLDLYVSKIKEIDDKELLSLIYEKVSDVYEEKRDMETASIFLQKAIELCEQVLIINATYNTRRNLLSLYIKLGYISYDKYDQKQAESLFLKSLSLGEDLLKEKDTVENRYVLANCYKALGWFYENRKNKWDYEKAIHYYNKIYYLYERLYDDGGIESEWKELMNIYEILGRLYEESGDLKNAENFYKEAHSLCKNCLKDYGVTIDKLFFLLSIFERLGDLNYKKENYCEAEKYYKFKFALDKRLNKITKTKDSIDSLFSSCERLSNLYKTKENYDEAEKYFNMIYSLGEHIEEDNKSIKAQKTCIGYYMLVGDFYKERNNFEFAEKFYVKGIDISKKLLEKNDIFPEYLLLLTSYTKLINLCKEEGNLIDADKYYREKFELNKILLEKTEEADYFRKLIYSFREILNICELQNLAYAEEYSLNLYNFIEHLEEKIEDKKLLSDLINFYQISGDYFHINGKISNAKKCLRKSLDLCWKLVDKDFTEEARYRLANVYWSLGQLYEEDGNNSEVDAQECFRKQSEICESLMEETKSEKILRTLSFGYERQANIYYKNGNINKALEYYNKAFYLSEQLFIENNNYVYRCDLAIGYHQLGLVYMKLEMFDDAENFFQNTYSLLEQNYNESQSIEDYRLLTISYQDFGDLNRNKGDLNQAEVYYQENLRRRKIIFDKTNKLADYRDLGKAYCCLACFRKPYDQNLIQKALEIYTLIVSEYPEVEEYLYEFEQIKKLLNNGL